ncbi:AraC family transcriptional regulator ligand-binding domain-containing protein [Thalassomonas viridans]|uniref:AraC family transcriptional regulator ligand-binding domain-containing protein n=1 Tax=Thalassomonas viridans TaxID=137584 RepID=A0AAE9Z988_9GAMM|nr:AraC family transcriptional regulator [Thalassomonas viridans]WDE08484.1 AraC family transcriptional regulator ligand-binding domain-containing protein [Thalassomonas viridans]
MTKEITASSLYIRMLFRALNKFETDKDELKKICEINKVASDCKRAGITEISRIWECTAEILPCTHLGLFLGKNIHLVDYGVISFLWMNCENLKQALEYTCEFKCLLNENLEACLRREKDLYVYTLQEKHKQSGHIIDFDFSSILWMGRMLSKKEKEIYFHSIEFTSPPVGNKSHYEDFFSCPVSFNRENNLIRIPAAVLETPIYSPNLKFKPEMLSLVKGLLCDELGPGFLENVEQFINDSLSAGVRPSLGEISSFFAQSPSTFKRSLKEKGYSYSDICNKVVMQNAEKMLKSNAMTVFEIALSLDFSSSSAFHRAFKRWKGVTPREYVKNSC